MRFFVGGLFWFRSRFVYSGFLVIAGGGVKGRVFSVSGGIILGFRFFVVLRGFRDEV